MLKSELAGYMEIFHCGEQYAAVSRELEMAFGIKGAELRALINALRRDGVPICSNEKGYFYAETDAELLQTIRHMSSRIAGISGAIRGLKKRVYGLIPVRPPCPWAEVMTSEQLHELDRREKGPARHDPSLVPAVL